ncbi:hypothetical protein BDZ97DRAFT_1862360 [Flammula alnicola]|nr:hypothetical protein BDZ97DRAFT_1862360 [Flammula alnicola]
MRAGLKPMQDPLNTLPLLLPCDNLAARNIISVIGECGSAKEVVMTVQEAAERLERTLEAEYDEEEEEEEDQSKEGGAGEGVAEHAKRNSPVTQLLILIDLYASAIPRQKLRRKLASDTLRPLFEDLEGIVKLAGRKATQDEGRSMIHSIARLALNTKEWVDKANVNSPEDNHVCKAILRSLLDRALLACGHSLGASIAQRTLEECFPRLALRSRSRPDWEDGEKAILELLDAYRSLGIQSDVTNGPSSASDLIFSAYCPSTEIDPDKLLSFILPALISSIQTNTFLDESLAVLIKSLHTRQTRDLKIGLSDNIMIPLCGILPSIASAHPDPVIRYQVFRVLSLLLSSGEAQLRFQHLVEFTRDSEYPQMRVASVGLVKEALLEALSQPRGPSDLFCSPLFLRTFGPILFRPDPPDLFSSELTLKAFQETPEPRRLVECLSLYYILLLRDEQNLTGIRDKDVLKSVEHSLLSPLRSNIERWLNDSAVSKSHLHDITPIVSLKISLERVDAARSKLE